MSVPALAPAVRDALVRSAVYETLAMGFAYPEPEAIARFQGTGELALRECGDASSELAPRIQAALETVERSSIDELTAEHSRLFAGEVACSPYETEYETDPFAKSHQLADIAGFYRAFGLDVSEEHRSMVDFIATETEFMAVLCRKEAHAEMNGWPDRRAVSEGAQRAFIEGHLGRWTGVLAAGLRGAASQGSGDLYRRLADLLERCCGLDVERFDLHPRLLTRRMVSANDAQPPACDPRVAGRAPSS